MKWFRLVSVATIVLGLALATQASANTVHWVGPSGVSEGGKWVGPSQLWIEGFQENATIDAACFRQDLSVTPPSVWEAEVIRGDQIPYYPYRVDNPLVPTSTQLQQGAWLYGQFALNPTTEWGGIHDALWAVFQGTTPSGNTWYNQATDTTAGAAWQSVNLANYYVILPSAGATVPAGYPYTHIQPFITTPEPASLGLILMGSGLAAVVRRRRKA